jgi:hypothetical protein
MRRRRTGTALSLLAVGLVALSGCTASSGPCGPATLTLNVTVTDNGMDPSDLQACRDQDVTIVIDSQTDGEFHLHGYDIGQPLTAGQEATVEFTADVAGQFIIERHGETDEAEIGVLTVNEP